MWDIFLVVVLFIFSVFCLFRHFIQDRKRRLHQFNRKRR